MPYINVDEAYILDNTGLQVDQVVDIPYTDAALTDGQKEQARKNIAAGGTNPNLLDNPFLTVNQRGASGTVGASAYYLDRWKCTYASGVSTSVGTGYVTLDGTANGDLVQPISELPLGKTVTLSALLSDGTIESVTGTMPATTPASATWVIDGSGTNVRLRIRWSGAIWQVYITPVVKPVTINAVKLEVGTVSTLANDTPPNYAEELAKCQYYFERVKYTNGNLSISTGMSNGTYLYFPVTIHPKRAACTITMTGNVKIGKSSASNDVSSIYTSGTSQDPSSGHIHLAVQMASNIGYDEAWRLILTSGSYFDFSADL
jgi:hypothetical protein